MFKLTKMFEDPTKGLINTRFIKHTMEMMDYTDLTDKEKQQLFDFLILIGKKLALVWQHYQDYLLYEDNEIKKAKANPITPGQKILQLEPSQDLFFKFDDFLVQVKSCLDYLVKVPAVIIGSEKWKLRTFGDKGREVIRALQNNLPKENKKMAVATITLIEKHLPWIEDAINARDKINHFIDGGINFEFFTIIFTKDNEQEMLRIPMWSQDQSIRDFMGVIWNNLFCLCEDFVVSLIYFKIKKDYAFFHGTSDIASIESPWKVTTKEKMNEIVSKPGWRIV